MRIVGALTVAAAIIAAAAVPVRAAANCETATFKNLLGRQTIPGADIIDVAVQELRNFFSEPEARPRGARYKAETINACQVTLTYNNPNTNSTDVTVTIWLPPTLDKWTGRFLGTGGGGSQCNMGLQSLNYGIVNGMATALTNGGVWGEPFGMEYSLHSPGNPNVFLLERLGHRAIHDMTIASKAVIEQFFGSQPSSSYYLGCSTGGRQGIMEAARYPEDYDGLLIGAPGVLWNPMLHRLLAETAAMNVYNVFPSSCEVEAIRQAAIEACDHLDGRIDGIIARPDLCKFTPQKAVGREYIDNCSGAGKIAKVSAGAARVVQISLSGAMDSNGRSLGPGFVLGTDMSTANVAPMHLRQDPRTGKSTGQPFPLAQKYVEDYVENGLKSIDWTRVNFDDITRWADIASQRYTYIMEPSDDLSAFRKRGGKIIWYHGSEDYLISPGTSLEKLANICAKMYPRANTRTAIDALSTFIRFAIIPGMTHCTASAERIRDAGWVDHHAVQQLIAWVEAGQPPERLRLSDGDVKEACFWPSLPKWVANGPNGDNSTLTMTCIENPLSFIGRLPRLTNIPLRYMELLPRWLFLRTEKMPGEL